MLFRKFVMDFPHIILGGLGRPLTFLSFASFMIFVISQLRHFLSSYPSI